MMQKGDSWEDRAGHQRWWRRCECKNKAARTSLEGCPGTKLVVQLEEMAENVQGEAGDTRGSWGGS